MHDHRSSGLRSLAASSLCAAGLLAHSAAVAQGAREMGTGIPSFGTYSAEQGVKTTVWSLSDPVVPFPSGCPQIVLTAATMGMDTYKIALATMLLARTTSRSVRFYAHGSHDGGCGVDYVQLN